MESLSEVTDVMVILRQWEEEHSQFNYDPVPTLTRLAEIIEAETENYMKMDPDPFDERHPSRADPDCALGHILKVLFRKDNFMNKLVNDYLRDNYWARTGNPGKDSRKLTVAVCRLILDIMPGLETSAVFQPEMESTVLRLFSWAEKSSEPLQSYATGMLAAAMEVQDIAANFREQNSKLVPLMLQRLHKLQARAMEERQQVGIVQRPFAHLGSLGNDVDAKKPVTASCSSSSSLRSKKRSIEGRHKENGGFKHRSPLSSPPAVPVGSPPLSEPTLEAAEASQVNGVVSSPGRTCGIKRFKELEDELLELSSVEGTNCSTPARDSAVMSPPPVSLLKHSPSSGINSIADGDSVKFRPLSTRRYGDEESRLNAT